MRWPAAEFAEEYRRVCLANPTVTNQELAEHFGMTVHGVRRAAARARRTGTLRIMRGGGGGGFGRQQRATVTDWRMP